MIDLSAHLSKLTLVLGGVRIRRRIRHGASATAFRPRQESLGLEMTEVSRHVVNMIDGDHGLARRKSQ